MLKLYTQPKCFYCNIMRELLDKTLHTYQIINIKEDPEAFEFIKSQGHTTVPQLYYNDIHLNKEDTSLYTLDTLNNIIDSAINRTDWPWQDSGIEQGL